MTTLEADDGAEFMVCPDCGALHIVVPFEGQRVLARFDYEQMVSIAVQLAQAVTLLHQKRLQACPAECEITVQ